ncbi:MAG: hypothetical protein KF886_23600, partial [Candidatus Hydrogenedentes bacterium]|nr:hypothetical protein [Candidatus Hydrogenedentota bacterium]
NWNRCKIPKNVSLQYLQPCAGQSRFQWQSLAKVIRPGTLDNAISAHPVLPTRETTRRVRQGHVARRGVLQKDSPVRPLHHSE